MIQVKSRGYTAKAARGLIWFETVSGVRLTDPVPWDGEKLTGYQAKLDKLREDLETFVRLEWFFLRGAKYE